MTNGNIAAKQKNTESPPALRIFARQSACDSGPGRPGSQVVRRLLHVLAERQLGDGFLTRQAEGRRIGHDHQRAEVVGDADAGAERSAAQVGAGLVGRPADEILAQVGLDGDAAHGTGYIYTGPVGGFVIQAHLGKDLVGRTTYKTRTYLSGVSLSTGLGVADDLGSLMVMTDPSAVGLAGQEAMTKTPLCEDMN